MNEKIKELKRFSLFLFVLGLILTIGGSYAVYRYTYVSTDDNKITTESTSIEFLESNTNVISLENALPMSDADGKKLDDTFDFVVNTKTSKTLDIGYSLVLEKLEPTSGYTQLEDKDVNFYLTDYNNNPLVQNNISKISKDYVIYTKTNSHNSSAKEIKDKYKLRIWLDKDVDVSDWNENTKFEYKFKIGVKTNVGSTDTEETYTVKYNANTGTGNMPSTTFKQGESKKLSKNIFTKEGCVFAGWSTSNNSKNVVYKDEEEVSNLTNVYNGVVNLYAVWVKEVVTYQVRYNANGGTGEMMNSSFVTETASKLSKNMFTKTGNTFKGWSTTPNGEVKYNDEEEVISLTTEKDKIVDLYAVWELNKYEVNVVVQNGTINDESTKTINYNEDGIFNITPNIENALGVVTCTNNQNGAFKDNQVTIKNVTNNTTCTVKVTSEVTSLYEDGTLIINEQNTNRNANIANHGKVTNEYNAMDSNNSYVLYSGGSSPWYDEYESVKSVEIGKTIQPTSTAYWFYDLTNMEKGDFTNLDTSGTTNMSYMFSFAGSGVTTFNLDLSNFNTSNVTDMSHMLWYAGQDATTWSIGDLSNWNTSNVTDMDGMFFVAGYSATTWEIGNLSNWDTSNVTNMNSIFREAGFNATTWSVGDLSNWNTSNVTNMGGMFNMTGYNATTWSVGDLSNWNTSKVTSMWIMFRQSGYNATTFNLDLSNWDTSNVTDMEGMFSVAGSNATTWSIGNISNWNTSNVTDMSDMFYGTGGRATTFNLDLSSWDTSNVTDMSDMFSVAAAVNATTFNLDLSNWDTSNVTDMSRMFSGAGESATTFTIKGLSNWDTSNVTDMSSMFASAGFESTTLNLDLSNWNTSNITDMSDMFSEAGCGIHNTTWNVKIPSTTGSLTNTTSKWYGNTESVYAEPPSGKSFTLS